MELHYDALTADPRRQARTDARRWGWELIIPVHKDVIGTEISNQYGNLSQNAACLQELPRTQSEDTWKSDDTKRIMS
jgi:hypothetical protein